MSVLAFVPINLILFVDQHTNSDFEVQQALATAPKTRIWV